MLGCLLKLSECVVLGPYSPIPFMTQFKETALFKSYTKQGKIVHGLNCPNLRKNPRY